MEPVRWLGGIALLAAVAMCLALASPAGAAFPGHNGVLAVQPLHGDGIVLVGADGRGRRRICTDRSVCGNPVRPRFSPDGRSIMFAGPAVKLIGTDGSCQSCKFGPALSPAFRPGGSVVTFSTGASVVEDGFDGLRVGTVVTPSRVQFRLITDEVWSASAELAVVAGGRIWIGRPPAALHQTGTGSAPSWSPDGSRLAISRGGWITIVRVRNHAERRLARGTAPAFSPDGRWITYIGAKHGVRLISSSGGRSRAVPGMRGLGVDWQPLPANPPPCVAPPGAKVLAQSDQAVLMGESSVAPSGDPLLPGTAVMGCLIADGRERLLELSTFNSIDGATAYGPGRVAGPYAALVNEGYDEHYGGSTQTIDVFDLRTGKRSGFGGESAFCESYSPCGGIDRLLLGPDGVTGVHVDGTPPTATLDSLQVTCASESLCLAFNRFGDVSSSTTPTSGPWKPARLPGAFGPPNGSSCPTVSLCVVVSGLFIYASSDPTGDSSAWTAAAVQNSPLLDDVSCPTTSLCVAVGERGTVLVSTDPTGGASAWSLEKVDGDNLITHVSCPSASECIATDLKGNVITTTDPTGGAGAWSVRNITSPNNGLGPIACPSDSLCVASAFGEVLESTDPASGTWTATKQNEFAAISCPSTSLCVALGALNGRSNGIYLSTDPASGNWIAYTAGNAAGSLQSISCPSTSFCVAAGADDGNVLITNNPSGGPSAWTPVFADKISCPIAPGACTTEQIVGSDRTGVRTLDSSTEFEPQTGVQLSNLTLTGDTLTWSNHGSPMSAQLTP